MLSELQKFKKKMSLLPNALEMMVEKQAFIEGTLITLGMEPDKVTAEGKNAGSSMYLLHLLHIKLIVSS
jgi:hypothetical protein